jgi:predicted MFS family arabinose efflux permease
LFPERGPWRHRNFRRLWSAQVVSAMGSRVTRTALPIIAVKLLGVGALAAALLGALAYGPGAVVGLLAGGWVDRRSKRGLLIAADLIRFALVMSLPIAYWLDALGFVHVCIVASGVGACSALFRITTASYLPEVVAPAELLHANGVGEATESVAEIGGPAIAGPLIAGLGAALAVVLDAFSYLWSAAFLRGLPEGRPAPTPATGLRADIAAGMRALWRDPIVRRLAIAEAIMMLGVGAFLGLYMIYVLDELALGEAAVGLVIACGGVGALLGALIAPRLLVHPATLVVLLVVSEGAALLIPAARGSHAAILSFLIVHQLVGDGAHTAYEVVTVTIRQQRIAADVLGRANGAFHAIMTASLLVSALASGLIADATDARTALWIGLGAGALSPLAMLGLRPRDLARRFSGGDRG